VDASEVFAGLNPEQRRAVEAVLGPVCILAGAGSGKTTTITRRIANQVLTGAFAPSQLLAVTFTDKAAGEMRARLARLGVSGVPARTFHSSALAQLHHFLPEGVGSVLPSKALLVKQSAGSLPRPFRFRPLADLANEVEWAKNRRLTPATYLDGLGLHEPPIPPDLMAGVFAQYERRKQRQSLVDFEDLLELAIRLYDEDENARATFHDCYRAFTVDEYQDVNLLQQTLLERWLGDRDELCVVGDDYQSIYSFTGATPDHLLAVPSRFPNATVVRLERNYRSTPEILAFANRLVPELGGAEKVLTAMRPSGESPVVRPEPLAESEVAAAVARVQALRADGVQLEEMAVLYRINAQSEEFEEALSQAGIPYQVRGGAFLARPAARHMLRVLRRSADAPAAETARATAHAQGLLAEIPGGLGEEEMTRQADLARFVRLAEEFDDGTRRAADFLADLEKRFGAESQGRGVNLLTYHRAKGLEFEVVFLPRLEEGLVPYKRSRSVAARWRRSGGFSTLGSRARSRGCSSAGRRPASRAASSPSSASGRPLRSARPPPSTARPRPVSLHSSAGASSSRARRACRRTSYSATAPSRRSPAASRRHWASSASSPGSAPPSSLITAPPSSPSSASTRRRTRASSGSPASRS
jgi:DNA helicase-2/ATP-dependent DNA helicase PcrA